MNKSNSYILATQRPWGVAAYGRLAGAGQRWYLVEQTFALYELLSSAEIPPSKDPRYVFFLHWSDRVPHDLLNGCECIGFHMTALPFGRGGSPLQNLIARGYRSTKLTAYRMTNELDAGPIYLQEDLSLEGGAEEIYIRAAEQAVGMMKRIIAEAIQPVPQVGEATGFQRRAPAESEIGHLDNLRDVEDHIRMLDAEGYPLAFLVHRGYRYEFRRPALYTGRIEADVRITEEQE